MKPYIFILIILVIGISSCEKKATEEPTGHMMFWTNKPTTMSGIYVSIENGAYHGNITAAYISTVPDCGALGCYTLPLSATWVGTHPYTATDGTHSWSGTFTI